MNATAEATTLFGFSPNSAAFQDWRQKAWHYVLALPNPTTKDEEYKYLPLNEFYASSWTAGQAVDVTEAELAAAVNIGLDECRVVFVNGFWSEELSTGVGGGAVEIVRLSENLIKEFGTLTSVEETSYQVAAHFGKLKKPAANKFAALNMATFEEGVLIRIKRNAVLETPIQIVFASKGQGTSSAPRVLIIAEGGSNATVIESFVNLEEGATFTNVVSEVFVHENAFLEHVKVQQESAQSTHIALTEAFQAQDSTYKHYNITFGGGTTRNDISVFIDGQNAHTRIDGITCATGSQLVDNHTRLDHAQPNCESFQVYKHLLNDESHAVFNGKIFVHQDAQKTDAKQTNQAILLSPTAVMNTKPQLEIFADDVKCTHGATIGQMDESAIFYFQARGIPKQEARALLIYAFAAEVIEQIQNAQLREQLESLLFERLR